jgi:YjbE family integral membrane protein
MEWSPVFPWLASLFSIILLDLVLSGDNALIIGMAARNLPWPLRRKAIIWGTVAAVALRIFFTILVVLTLQSAIPFVRLVGGLLLLWIALKLLLFGKSEHKEVEAGDTFIEAVKIIVMADITLSLDNMLAVGGVARDHVELVIFGLIFSIPILMIGAAAVASLLNRWPWLEALGSAIIAWVGADMLLHDPLITALPLINSPAFKLTMPVVVGVGIWLYGLWLLYQRRQNAQSSGATPIGSED